MAISLSSGVRQSLQSLQSTASQAQAAQGRLASGKKVNSAVDNPTNFFTAQNLNNRADQFSGLLDGISNSVQTIKNASTGIDAITKQVKALQGTIKQAQADAATNRPKIASTVNFGSVDATTPPNSSAQDVALNKVLIGTAAAATATSAGAIGVTAAGAGSTNSVQIKAGNATYKFDVTSTSTVRDLVNGINSSGIASAAVGSDGKMTITGTGSDALTVEAGTTLTSSGAFTAVAADQTALFASVDNTAVVATGNSSVRSNLVAQFNDARTQLDQLAKDAGFNGTNLLAGDKMKVVFNEKTGAAQSKLDVQGQTISSDNLGVAAATDAGFQNDTTLAQVSDALTNALSSLQSTSSSLGSSLSTVQTRQDFSKALIDNLRTGADNLTNADPNEEGASLLALQTRQQLSQTALSLSSQADQAVLRLF